MADCYASEADDFHRRWLPWEIFVDIGIVDTEPLDAIVMEPEETADAAKLAVQLIGIIDAGQNKGKSVVHDPSPPPLTPAIYAPCHFTAPVWGLERAAFMSYGGASITSPMALYSSVMWQVANYSLFPQSPLCLVSQPCHGTGVFLPRTDVYHRRTPSPTKDGKAAVSRTRVAGRPVLQQQQKQKEGEAAGAERSHKGKASVALPKEWSYSRVHRGNSQ